MEIREQAKLLMESLTKAFFLREGNSNICCGLKSLPEVNFIQNKFIFFEHSHIDLGTNDLLKTQNVTNKLKDNLVSLLLSPPQRPGRSERGLS